MQIYSSFNPKISKQYYKKRKNYTLYIIIFAIIALITTFIVWSILKTPTDNTTGQTDLAQESIEPTNQAKIIYLKGILQINQEGQWQNLTEKDILEEGAEIKTATDSRAIIQLPEASLLRIDAETTLKFITLNNTDIVVEQLSGQIYHRVNDQGTAIYRVRNNTVELTALGTGFNTKIATNKLYLTVIESRVKVKIFEDAQTDNILNMRTIDQSYSAIINPNLEQDKTIESKEENASSLLDDDWINWNKNQDEENNFELGVFSKNIKLEITEPKTLETETEETKIVISGNTDQDAEIYFNGQEVKNDNGQFSKEVELNDGENQIEISVIKGTSKNKKTLTIISKQKDSEKITLQATQSGSTIKLTWQTEELGSIDNFLTLQAKTENPKYPDDTYHKVSKTANSDQWDNLANGTYTFRVCAYENQTCRAYSNNVLITLNNSPEINADASIYLNGRVENQEIYLSWDVKNFENFENLKVIINTDANPVYPINSSHNQTKQARSDTWKGLNPGTYHFRVCAYGAEQCLLYSNNFSLTINQEQQSEIGQITLSGNSTNSQANLAFTTKNIAAPKGYYALASENPSPNFPSPNFKLLSSASDATVVWDNLEIGKTYYFRICENLGNACGIFSNEIALTIK
jgi:hypothetical protein